MRGSRYQARGQQGIIVLSFVTLCVILVVCCIPIQNEVSIERKTPDIGNVLPCHAQWKQFFEKNVKEKKVYSQNGEDGVIQALLERFGSSHLQHNKFFVEFGTESVTPSSGEMNTRWLRTNLGYKGLLLDGGFENAAVNLHKEFVTPSNIVALFQKYQVPHEFDLLSIDVNYDDYFVWQALLQHKNEPSSLLSYRPKVVVIEYNSKLGPRDSLVANPHDSQRWTGTDYFGASFQAFKRLGHSNGYTVVYGESMGINLFFVRADLLNCSSFATTGMPDDFVFHPPGYGNNGHPTETNQSRRWIRNPDPKKNPQDYVT